MRTLRLRPLGAALTASLCFLATAPAARADDVSFETKTPGLELWNQTREIAMVPVRVGRGTALQRAPVYKPLCLATPCSANVAPGLHIFGLSRPGESIVEGPPLVIDRETNVTATYHDNSALRTAGAIVLGGALLGGLVLLLASIGQSSTGGYAFNPPVAGVAGGVALGGFITGIALMAQSDSATFSLTPLLAVGPSAKREGTSGSAMNGLAATVRF